jgi:hypothetical protein
MLVHIDPESVIWRFMPILAILSVAAAHPAQCLHDAVAIEVLVHHQCGETAVGQGDYCHTHSLLLCDRVSPC